MAHRLRLILIGVLLAMIVILLVGPRLALGRSTVERFLASYFAGRVQMQSFTVSLWPAARATATSVTLRRQGLDNLPPLVTIARAEVDASILGLLRSPRHLHRVRVDGLTIRVPPGSRGSEAAGSGTGGGNGPTPPVVDRVIADEARLEILPDEPGRHPVTFDLRHLDARGVARDRPLTFHTELVNPKPRGLIDARGTFGPWNPQDAGATTASGEFTYRGVDLNTIRGIAGHLSAEGTFRGPLRRITVRGSTHSPDFSVDIARQPVPLDTNFDAYVDGTNGNTYLNEVRARFFRTTIVATGAIVDQPDPASRAVTLDVTIRDGRLEDVMRFALSSAPPLAGALQLQTRFRLPGDERDVMDKLQLDGRFAVRDASFASEGVRSKVDELSARAQGKPEGEPGQPVGANFRGEFRLDHGTLTFTRLDFEIPGAAISLRGTYTLRTEVLDMRGTLRIAAKISETTSGWKSVLLKVVDPVFAKGKRGSVVPVTLTGTAREPKFGLDAGRVLKGK